MYKELRKLLKQASYCTNRFLIKRLLKSKYLHSGVFEERINYNHTNFYGYYNIDQFNKRNEMLFCSIAGDGDRRKEAHKYNKIDVCNYNIKEQKIEKLGESRSWNWQQGCMLQWFQMSNDEVIYNDYNAQEDQYYAKITNVLNGKSRKISYPIYSVAKCDDYALTLNFDRLAWLRPDYGYFTKKNIKSFELENDGIWYINLSKDTQKLIISFKDLIEIDYRNSMNTYKHKVNHIDISPDSQHFLFLHRWYYNGVKFTRLIVSDKYGKKMRILCGDTMVSHCIWKNNSEIVGYAHVDNLGDKYFIFNIYNEGILPFYPKLLSEDGHPSFDNSGRFFITDTYPKRDRFSKLVLVDTATHIQYILGSFYQPIKFSGEYRVDLHPRFSKDGKYISIDSGHEGYRRTCLFDVSPLIEQITSNCKEVDR